MEVPKMAVFFLEKILQGFVLERILLVPFYWGDNDTRDVSIWLRGEYPFVTAITTQLSDDVGVNTSLVEAGNILGVQYDLRGIAHKVWIAGVASFLIMYQASLCLS